MGVCDLPERHQLLTSQGWLRNDPVALHGLSSHVLLRIYLTPVLETSACSFWTFPGRSLRLSNYTSEKLPRGTAPSLLREPPMPGSLQHTGECCGSSGSVLCHCYWRPLVLGASPAVCHLSDAKAVAAGAASVPHAHPFYSRASGWRQHSITSKQKNTTTKRTKAFSWD